MICKCIPQNNFFLMATTYIPQSKFSWAKYMKLKRIAGTLAIFVWNKPKPKKKKKVLSTVIMTIYQRWYWYFRLSIHAGGRKKWKYFNFMRILWALIKPLPAELSTLLIYPAVSHKGSLKHCETLNEEVGLQEDILPQDGNKRSILH